MNIELKILDFIQTLHIPILDKIMVWITSLGDAGMIWILLTAIFLIMPKTRRSGSLCWQHCLCRRYCVCGPSKICLQGSRPYDVNTTIQLLVPKLQDFSFPSGHTSASFTIVSALYFAKDSLWKPTLVLACLIAVSRLYLYVHYPTDVLGGIILGILSGYAGYRIIAYIAKQKQRKKHAEDQRIN